MAYLKLDREVGETFYLSIEGLDRPIKITNLGESPDRKGQNRLLIDNVGVNRGIKIIREEQLKINHKDY